MFTVSEAAQNKIVEILRTHGQEGWAIRVRILGRGIDRFAYDIHSVPLEMQREGDLVIDAGPFKVLLDAESAPLLEEATLNFDASAAAFQIDNPNPVWEDDLGRRVAEVLIEQVNPSIAAHGGAVLPVDVRDGVVYVRMFGGCQGCGMASATLTLGVERALKEAIPEVRAVVDITHHAAGTNPYYPSRQDQAPEG